MERLIIIGAGLAGLSAAIAAAKRGTKCILVSAQASERAQSVLAEGGINAALDTKGEHDSIREHYCDTLKGGCFLADPNAVKGLTSAAPKIVDMLKNLGVPFNRDGALIDLRSFGGQRKKRTAYAKNSTGKMLMTALIDETRKYESRGLVERLPHHTFVELSLFRKKGAGCFVRDSYTDEILFLSGAVILASGGLNGMFGAHTTGTTQNTGEVTATVFKQGLTLGNLEFIQYHPTTFSIQGKRCLISEAARGEGGRLFVLRNGTPWYFLEDKYPEYGNLMPRDIVSREMTALCGRDDCGAQVYLDMTAIPRGVWDNKLPELKEECIHYLHRDPAKEPVPVEPGIHYFMGGVLADSSHRTNVKNVYAAGECCCQYHGANRLGGNSMLGAIYGGITAVKSAIADYEQADASPQDRPVYGYSAETSAGHYMERLTGCLTKGLGVVRTEQRLLQSIEEIEALQNVKDMPVILRDKMLLGLAMLKSALYRKESRGSHYREDYPHTNSSYRKTSTAYFNAANIVIGFEAVPQRKEEQDEEDAQSFEI
ncbi:MAG: FAD-binding protein [Treponema sp.]|nr:FAD-binding protein [Treponema sp.]